MMTEREYCLVSALQRLRAAHTLVCQAVIHTYTPDIRADVVTAVTAIEAAVAKLEPEIKVRAPKE